MKHKLTFFFIFFLFYCGYSQNYKVNWSKEEKGDNLPQFAITNFNGEIIAINVKSVSKGIKKLKIKKFDKNLKLLKTIEQKDWESTKWKAKDYILNGLINVGGKVYLILYKKEKKDYLVYKNELTNDLKASDKFEQVAVNASSYKFSKNKSKFILYDYYDFEKQKHIRVSCFDNNFQKLWSKEINLKLNDRDIEINNTVISDEGNVYINYEMSTKKGVFGGTIDYENFILQISNNGENLKNIDLDFSQTIFPHKIFIDNNEYTKSLNVMGFYSNKKGRTKINGIVNVVIDEKSLELKAKNVTKFTENEYKYFFISDKKAEKKSENDKGFENNMEMIGQYAMSDGGTMYLTEEYEVTSYSDDKRTYYEYFYGKLFIVKTDEEGNIEWTKILNRSQGPYKSYALPYMGSYSFMLDDKVYLLYNDSEKNINFQEENGDKNIKRSKRTGNIKKAMAVLKIIDTKGEIKSDVVLDGKEEDVIFNTDYSLKLNEQQLLLFANKKKLTKIGSLFVKQLDVPLKYNPSKIKAIETTANADGIIQKESINSGDIIKSGMDKSTETAPIDASTNTSIPKVEGKITTSSPTNTTPEVKTPPAEAPKPVYTPSSVSPGRKATDSELDFFNKLREQQPAAEPAK